MIGHRWTGWDGSVFDLRRTPGSSIWLTAEGVEGMGMPASDDFTREAEVLDGQEFLGWRAKPRSVFWPIAIDAGDNWQKVQAGFWRSLTPGRVGVWRVTAPDGSWRELRCRFSEADEVYETDPSVDGFEERGVSLIADDPWWRGDSVTHTFRPQAPVPFFSTAGPGVLELMSAFSLDRAQITNTGDVDAWPVWEIEGPTSGFSVGVGSATVAGSLVIPAGRSVFIDSDPISQVIQWDNGTLVPYAQLDTVGFAPVPSGARVSLAVHTDGTDGAVTVTLSPRYLRAV